MEYKIKNISRFMLILMMVIFLHACTSIKGKNVVIKDSADQDSIEPINRLSFFFNDTADRFFLKPIAISYVKLTPNLFRKGISNFFENFSYLNVVLNNILQGKIDQGLMDSARFVFNSTIGIAGIVDVATVMGFEKHKEDFGQTLAVWGIGQGSYLYVPLQGPNTFRNAPNAAISYLFNPINYLTDGVFIPIKALNTINKRANLLKTTDFVDEVAIDPYSFIREAYLQQRRFLIYDGDPPIEGYEDIFGTTDVE